MEASPSDSARYRKLASDYAEQLAEVGRSEKWLQATMHDYGRYLHQHGVRPEHIVICVRESMEDARFQQYADQRRLIERAIEWAIEGYYTERAAKSP